MNRREFLAGVVALPVALRFAPGALAGGTPVALVTADTQARVAVVELSTGKILRSIPTTAGPRSIESVWGKLAVVCHPPRCSEARRSDPARVGRADWGGCER